MSPRKCNPYHLSSPKWQLTRDTAARWIRWSGRLRRFRCHAYLLRQTHFKGHVLMLRMTKSPRLLAISQMTNSFKLVGHLTTSRGWPKKIWSDSNLWLIVTVRCIWSFECLRHPRTVLTISEWSWIKPTSGLLSYSWESEDIDMDAQHIYQ